MRHRSRRVLTGLLRTMGCASVVIVSSACHEGIDTQREAVPKVTLGHDMYGIMCDRVGASVLTEDLTGESYEGVCHPTKKGNFDSEVDTSFLPKVKGTKAKEARRLALAKMAAMARRRDDLIMAFNASFPDVEIDNVATDKVGDTVEMHTALKRLTQTMVPLYDDNPYDKNDEALAPGVTRSLGRLFDELAKSEPARQALAQIWARQGYRPSGVGLGAIRPAMAYPNLRALTVSAVEVLGPNAEAVPELQQVLRVSKEELLTAAPVVSPLANISLDPATGQLNRPRSNSEVARALLFSESSTFASPETPERFLTHRDRRGFAVPIGNTPGIPGTVPAPFSDLDGDGFADVDPFGRFVDGAGAPIGVGSPFAIPGVQSAGEVDVFGRPAQPLFEYVDSSRTVGSVLARRLSALLDGTQYGDPNDPNAWMIENETLMYALSGSYVLFGGREEAVYDYNTNTRVAAGTTCDGCVDYTRFRGEDSPLVALAHATGQVLADPNSDAMILGAIDLLENHEPEVARLVGAALRLRAIAAEHDARAAQGLEAPALVAYEVPVWDELAQVVDRITDKPGLAAKLLGAIGDPAIVTPSGGVEHMGINLALNMEMRDELTYDKNNINGPAVNLSVGGASTADPMTPVDRSQPPIGTNRSMMQRNFQLIVDAAGASTCNKQGAKVKSSIFGLTLDWPLIGSYDECELFEINDLAKFYLGTLLIPTHPKRSELVIKSGTLNSLIGYLGIVATPDELFEQSSGISGMTLHPDPPALNRLVYFGTPSDKYSMPDLDQQNQNTKTNKFISALIEPTGASVCPKNANGVTTCPSVSDTMRIRDPNTIFIWERLGFYDYLRPVVTAFAEASCNETVTSCDLGNTEGEQMFIDLLRVLNVHWAGPAHGDECNPSGNLATNPKYCSEAGLNTYEPILGDSFRSDIVPALHEFALAADQLSQITIVRGPNAGQTLSGADVLELITKSLFNQDYAAAMGVVDRNGNPAATWTDGTPQAQTTPYNLFSDALHQVDVAFTGQEEYRQGQWRRARSQLVDEFFGVEGSGPGAHFKNPETAQMLVASMRILRQQLNANCPNRELGEPCTWARRDIGDKLAQVISGPLFSTVVDLQEQIRLNPTARREMQFFLQYIMQESSGHEALQSTMASMLDLMQLLSNDEVLTPILQATAAASRPADDQAGPGCADRALNVMKALTDAKYDKYHVMDRVFPNLVTPITDPSGVPIGLSPIEIFIDTIAEVHRYDASDTGPLSQEDYRLIMSTVRDFFLDDRRGLEQFYTIISKRPRE